VTLNFTVYKARSKRNVFLYAKHSSLATVATAYILWQFSPLQRKPNLMRCSVIPLVFSAILLAMRAI